MPAGKGIFKFNKTSDPHWLLRLFFQKGHFLNHFRKWSSFDYDVVFCNAIDSKVHKVNYLKTYFLNHFRK